MLNKVTLIGQLGADPELKYTEGGTAYARMRLATTERFTSGGEKKERTEWHRVTAWGKLAEICGQYLSKGRLVYFEGRLRNDTWEQDGVKRYSYEIIAREMKMLGRTNGDNGDAREPEEPEGGYVPPEDIPF